MLLLPSLTCLSQLQTELLEFKERSERLRVRCAALEEDLASGIGSIRNLTSHSDSLTYRLRAGEARAKGFLDSHLLCLPHSLTHTTEAEAALALRNKAYEDLEAELALRCKQHSDLDVVHKELQTSHAELSRQLADVLSPFVSNIISHTYSPGPRTTRCAS